MVSTNEKRYFGWTNDENLYQSLVQPQSLLRQFVWNFPAQFCWWKVHGTLLCCLTSKTCPGKVVHRTPRFLKSPPCPNRTNYPFPSVGNAIKILRYFPQYFSCFKTFRGPKILRHFFPSSWICWFYGNERHSLRGDWHFPLTPYPCWYSSKKKKKFHRFSGKEPNRIITRSEYQRSKK